MSPLLTRPCVAFILAGGAGAALFMRHDGYIGSLGAFFGDDEPEQGRAHVLRRGSLQENFSRVQFISDRAVSALGVLDTVRDRMVEFPLLRDPAAYEPDTIPIQDDEQRAYWLTALDSSVDGLLKGVAHSMGKSDDVARRLDEFSRSVHPCAAPLAVVVVAASGR